MQRRYQSTMLGLIANEQLTGPAARAAQIQAAEERARKASEDLGEALAQVAKVEAQLAQATSTEEKANAPKTQEPGSPPP